MTPKKAIIVILILFLIMVAVFAFLYLKVQLAGPAAGLNNVGVGGGESLLPAGKVQQKIDKIIEQAKKDPTQNASAKVRQEIINLINAEVVKQEENKTAEQKAADFKAETERQKIINQVNSQLKWTAE